MDTNSLIQSDSESAALETAEELAGTLEIPPDPVVSTGFADIYHGFWTSIQGVRVEVAVKQFKNLIPRVRHIEQEALKKKKETRIKREVFVWSQITHPNLQPLLGYRLEPQPRLISPWCHHGNLEEYLRENPDLSRYDKLQLIYQAGRGLEHLHSRTPPICHADIKPENVLITDSRGTALSDFGLSRVLQDLEISGGFTTTETVKGTVRYMASELFAGQKANLEADVYAFGGLILTVMSGRPPFDGLLYHVILRRVMQNEPPIPKDHPNLPAYDPLWKLMRRCWDKTPAARPGMLEVLRELENDISYGSTTGNRISEAVLLAAREMLKALQINSLAIPVFGKYIVAAAEVGLNLVEIVQILNRSENTAKNLELNPLELANLLKGLVERSKQPRGDDILACVKDIEKKLEYAQGKLGESYTSDLFQNEDFLFDSRSHQTWQGTIQRVLEEIQLLAALDTTCLVAEFDNPESQEQHRRLLSRLGDGKYGAHGNAIEDQVCLPGTRVGVLERIDNWIRDSSTPTRVLWIWGMAGRGKSTIASTVAHNWQHRASCAIFHFRRGHNTLNARVVSALARQLGSSLIPEVRKAVLESVRENEDIAAQRLDVQFETLIAVPLSKLLNQSRTILLIVDALDECQNSKDAVDFVKLIDRHSSSFPTNVKFLLTCRPEAPLLRALESRGWQEEALDLSVNVEDDLVRFIEQGCARIREEHGLPQDWPARSDVERMVELSQGLFQWARTVIKYIGNGSPANRLLAVLKQPSTWSGLDNLYDQILSKAFDNVSQVADRQAILSSVLGTLVVAPYPVSLEVIAAVHGGNRIFEGVDRQDVIEYLRQDILVDLNSLILIPTSSTESIHFMHTSIRDLLVDKRRCKERVYFIDVRHHHEELASLCLGIMLQCLKENICDLSNLSKPNSEVQGVIERKVSTDIRYCCRAWSIHLTEGVEWSWLVTKGPYGEQGYFETFSKEKLLHWLEVMSLIGATPEAVVITNRVSSWLSRSHNWVLTRLWHDAHRFITAFSEPISFGALHIYASALAHCPQKTQLWECYGRHAKIRTLHGIQPLTWSANLWTRATGGHVHTIAFSPDGSVLASGSDDGTIRFWDTQTGTPLGQPLAGYTGEAVSVVFSPDGEVLVSGSDDGTIRLWDAETGMPLGEPLTGHTDCVASVAFSPDGRVLASGSWDRTIRLWDAQTGTPVGQPLTDHTGWVVSVAFSPDGSVLASGSDDRTIRLWDAQTGTPLGQPLIGHNRSVRSVAFSPDGRVLASGSFDRTIRLWDAQTGTPLGQPLAGHNHWVLSVAFSPDGTVLASGSRDRTIRLWDAETGTPLGQPLAGHNDLVRSVAFSPDSRVLVSGSPDRTIRLWDAQTAVLLSEPLTDHNDYVHSIAFSPDGKLLASGSDDGTIRLWDPQTGTPLGEPLTGHNDYVHSIVFSPDSQVLASRSNDATIRLWDTQTGTPLGKPLVAVNYMISFVPIPHADPQEISGAAHWTPDIQDHWVNLSGSRLFWLPSHYWVERPPTILLSNETLLINVNGTFSIFHVPLALQLS